MLAWGKRRRQARARGGRGPRAPSALGARAGRPKADLISLLVVGVQEALDLWHPAEWRSHGQNTESRPQAVALVEDWFGQIPMIGLVFILVFIIVSDLLV